jgi:uncharacterized LabA/DUF88 family protein
MDKCVIVVDNSNIFIEGQKASAKAKGVAPDPAMPNRRPNDPSWRIDFGGLLAELAAGRRIHAAVLVGSRPPKNDSVWGAAERHGFTVTVHDRSSAGKEKAVDTELVAQGTEIICCAAGPMDLVIASGDRDFVPLASVAHRRNWEVEMCAFSASFNPGGDLATAVDRVRPLDSIVLKIGRCDFEWPFPAYAPGHP